MKPPFANEIVDRVVTRAAPGEKHERRHCLECNAVTRFDKPYCQDHVLLNVEAEAVNQRSDSFEDEIKRGYGQTIEREVLLNLDLIGARTPKRLAVDLCVPAKALRRVLRVLERMGLVEIMGLGSRRGGIREVAKITEKGQEAVREKKSQNELCSEVGCEIQARSKGFCAKHYTKKYREAKKMGTTVPSPPPKVALPATTFTTTQAFKPVPPSPPKRFDWADGGGEKRNDTMAAPHNGVAKALMDMGSAIGHLAGDKDPTPVVLAESLDEKPVDAEIALMAMLAMASDDVRKRVLCWALDRWPS